MIDIIAFDADDTLWHNETLFSVTQSRFYQLLSPYHDKSYIQGKLYETESRNLEIFGYGIKGFALSMVETAIELTEGRIKGSEIQVLLDAAKEMLSAPVEPLPHVEDVLEKLAKRFPLMVITKGDLFDQESKIARSGLAHYFENVEIVSEKNPEIYGKVLRKYEIVPDRFMMVGNSLKSDILPITALGGTAVHIPYHLTWQHEQVPAQAAQDVNYYELSTVRALPALVAQINDDV